MRVFVVLVSVFGCVVTAQSPRVVLTGFALLPADSFAPGPPSGAWLNAEKLGTPQFPSQPVQGVSSISPVPGNPPHWWVLSDNGFGSKLNSGDYLLRIHQMNVQWSADANPSHVASRSFIQLADPKRLLPFPIAREMTAERWLTGADLDPESLVSMPDGTFWIGEEFGPFLVHVGADGALLERPFEIPQIRGPDHPHSAPADAGTVSPARVRRSRGFEGLAISGSRLYAALESGVVDHPGFARIYEFDLEKRAFTDQWWRYRLEGTDNAVTEFTGLRHLSDDCRVRFLAIERDGGHGTDAKFKRVFEVLLNRGSMAGRRGAEPLGPLAFKRLIVDLLAIDNPQRIGGFDVRFTFPFITTEAVWATAGDELVLANDNNFPAGGGRPGVTRDATEFIRLKLPQRLCTQRMR